MAISEATFTEFLRDPKRVTRRLDAGDVILHRRDEEDLRLSIASRSAAEGRVLGLLSGLVAAALRDPGIRSHAMASASLPWTQFLPEDERVRFFGELFACIEGAAQVGTLAPVERLMDEWRATAAIHADPDLARQLGTPMAGDGSRIPHP